MGFFVQESTPALTAAALLVDVICGVLAATILIGLFFALVASRSIAAWTGVVAGLASLLLSVAVLMANLSPQRSDRSVLAVACVGVVSSILCVRLLGFRWSRMQMTFGKRVAAIVTLVAIPAFNFWQEASYLPSQNEVSLETVLKAEPIAIADKSRHWLISGTVRNPSNVRASIVVSDLVACRWVDEVDRSASSIMDERGNTNCKKLERPLGRGWIDAGAQLEFSDTVPASEDHPLLGLRFSVAYARGDRLRTIQETSRDASSRERGRCSNVTVVRLQERSRLRSLALEPKFLMDADTNSDGGLNYFVAAQRDLKCPVTHDRELKDYYSLTELKVFSTDWLPARVQPTPVSSGSG